MLPDLMNISNISLYLFLDFSYLQILLFSFSRDDSSFFNSCKICNYQNTLKSSCDCELPYNDPLYDITSLANQVIKLIQQMQSNYHAFTH